MTSKDAEQALKAAGFSVLPGEDDYSNNVPAGRIFMQEPAAGKLYDPKNTIVIIYRSIGPRPTATPKSSGDPYLNVKQNSKCRGGPSQLYEEESFVYTGDRVKVVGKNPGGGWWLVYDPKKSRNCWVFDGAGTIEGDKSRIPFVDPPPPPTPESGMGDLSVTKRDITIYLRDHSAVDGDRVNLYVNGVLIVVDYTITGSSRGFAVQLIGGENTVKIEALNVGSDPPNTVEVSVSDVRIGESLQVSGELNTGQTTSFTIYAP